MATIITQIDQQVSNYETRFAYTIQASFNGIEGRVDRAQIRVFVPNFFQITMGDMGGPIESVGEEPGEGGKTLIFEFGAMEDLGVAVKVDFWLQYAKGTPSATSFSANAQLWVNDALQIQDTAPTISLSVKPDFQVYQERILPVVAPSKGSQVYYRVTVENQGDWGGVVENLTMIFQGNQGFQLDETFPVVGQDVSASYGDTQQDDRQGDVENNQLTFQLPRYWGVKYTFVYRGILSADVVPGENLALDYAWSHNTQDRVNQQETLAVGEAVLDGQLSLYGPRFTLANAPITYSLWAENRGNQGLSAVKMRHKLPPEIQFSVLKTATFHIGAMDQSIETTYPLGYITDRGTVGKLGDFSTAVAQEISLNGLVEGERIVAITMDLAGLGVGVSTKSPFLLDGTVLADTALGTVITKGDTMDWDGGGATATKETKVENTCVILPLGGVTPGGKVAKIGDTLRYTIGANCTQSRLVNPVFAMILPKELLFSGNITMSYSDHFQGESPILPPVSLTENYKGTGETLVKFSFANNHSFTFPQKSKMKISFDTAVKVGAIGDFQTAPFLQTQGADAYYPAKVATVTVDGATFGSGSGYWKTVYLFASISSDKKVKGNLDSQYSEAPAVGQVTEGGTVDYLLTVTNRGNAVFQSVEVVDILPHVGDRGVVVTNVARNSQFPTILSTEIVATVVPPPPPPKIFPSTIPTAQTPSASAENWT